jgi:hypothetical protein
MREKGISIRFERKASSYNEIPSLHQCVQSAFNQIKMKNEHASLPFYLSQCCAYTTYIMPKIRI